MLVYQRVTEISRINGISKNETSLNGYIMIYHDSMDHGISMEK